MVADLFWIFNAAAWGLAHGLLIPSLREYVPPTGWRARQVDYGLHYAGLVGYLLPLLLVPTSWPAAVFARALVFDLVLNRAAGRAWLEVGQTAITDRVLQAVAGRLGWAAPRLRLVLWLATLAAAAGFYYARR